MLLTSVLVPGFLFVTEVFLFWFIYSQDDLSIDRLAQIARPIQTSFILAIFCFLIVLALSTAAGFLSRELAFAISDFGIRNHRVDDLVRGMKLKYDELSVEGIIKRYTV